MWTSEQVQLWEAMELGPFWMAREGRSLWPARLATLPTGSFVAPQPNAPQGAEVRQAPPSVTPNVKPRVLRPRSTKAPRTKVEAVVQPKDLSVAWSTEDIQTLASADLTKIVDLVANCKHCPLAFERKHPLTGSSTVRPQVVIVDTMPSSQDEMHGQLLSGYEGKFMRNVWHVLGWQEEVDIAYIPLVKCRPLQGRRLHWQETQNCQKYLLRQIRLFAPKVVIALGAEVAAALLQESQPKALREYRGQAHPLVLGTMNTHVIATVELKHLMGHPLSKKRFWRDMVLAKRHLAQMGWAPTLVANWS